MKCSNCGHENPDKVTTCTNCGADLAADQLEQTMSFLIPSETVEEEKLINIDELASETPILVVVKGRDVSGTFPLDKSEVLIGRDPTSDIFLDDITVSRSHAKIDLHDDRAQITDVGSLNGTYINRSRIEESILANRDEIQIGKFKLIYLAKK